MGNIEHCTEERCTCRPVIAPIDSLTNHECPQHGYYAKAAEVHALRQQLRGAVEDLEALRAVLSPYSGFESHGARIQRAREMVTDLLADLGRQ
jgi:hypothetical protein